MGQTDADDALELVDAAVVGVADLQRSGIERLETKATFLLGFIATAVPLYVGEFSARRATHHGSVAFRNVALVIVAVSAIAAFWTMRPYTSEEAPVPKPFADAFFASPLTAANVSKLLIAQRVIAFESNRRVAKVKAVGTWIAFITFLIAAASSAWSLLR